MNNKEISDKIDGYVMQVIEILAVSALGSKMRLDISDTTDITYIHDILTMFDVIHRLTESLYTDIYEFSMSKTLNPKEKELNT